MSDKVNQQWGGRFSESTDEFVQTFTGSVNFDKRMFKEDIAGSLAHAEMLYTQKIISEEDFTLIKEGLAIVSAEIESGDFGWSIALEDVHMNIEASLTEKIGIAGKRLHTGRSRNDQVATDIRLWLRNQIDVIDGELKRLQHGILNVAKNEYDTIMPGFTHLQVAQPVTFGHHLMAWFEMIKRDRSRLQDARKRMNYSPLGAAALAGTTYNIDRHLTAKLLHFEAPTENSLDSVSDRDFAIEFTAVASILSMHLSRFAEEFILWATPAFDFINLPDRFCTGSSIMPQKKNPDVPELVRGKTGRVYGHLFSLLTLMKSQPLAYNKDNQEDKEPLFDTVDTIIGCVRAFADMIPAISSKKENMYERTKLGFATATDLADYLVRKGMPFRNAHEVVGNVVRLGVESHRDLADITLSEFQAFSSLITEDVFSYLTLEGSVAARDHFGATAPAQVLKAIQRAEVYLSQ